MTETGEGTYLLEALCQKIATLIQVVTGLQEAYYQLESLLPTASQASVSDELASTPAPALAPTIVVSPPKPQVPTPEPFSGNRYKFLAFRNAC